jgi:hypothetical protein
LTIETVKGLDNVDPAARAAFATFGVRRHAVAVGSTVEVGRALMLVITGKVSGVVDGQRAAGSYAGNQD